MTGVEGRHNDVVKKKDPEAESLWVYHVSLSCCEIGRAHV